MNWQTESIIFRAEKEAFIDKLRWCIHDLFRDRQIKKANRILSYWIEWNNAITRVRIRQAKEEIQKAVYLNQKPILRD